MIYRHIILTVPAMCRTTFYHNAAVLLSALMRCGVQCLDEFYSAVRGKVLQGGYSAVLHPHGRHGHCIPIRISWPRVVALMARGSGGSIGMICPTRCCVLVAVAPAAHGAPDTKSDAINRWVNRCCTPYPNGLVTNVPKGQVPSQYQSLARYVAQSVVSPPSSVRRIDRYEGERVTYHTGPTALNAWSTKPSMSTRLLAGWCSTRYPKVSSVSGMTGCRPPRRLPR